jgi:hypothetical protein
MSNTVQLIKGYYHSSIPLFVDLIKEEEQQKKEKDKNENERTIERMKANDYNEL